MRVPLQPWVANAEAGPVSLVMNGDWVRWDRDFTLSVAKTSKHSVTAVGFDTTVPSLVWNPNPNRFSIGSSTALTYEDIYIVTGTLTGAPSPLLTMYFTPGIFTAGGQLTYGLSVYNPLQGSAREDGDRLEGTHMTVTLDDGTTYTSTIKAGVTSVHGPFTGYGLVDADKAVFPAH
jgi:hypothetical protein